MVLRAVFTMEFPHIEACAASDAVATVPELSRGVSWDVQL